MADIPAGQQGELTMEELLLLMEEEEQARVQGAPDIITGGYSRPAFTAPGLSRPRDGREAISAQPGISGMVDVDGILGSPKPVGMGDILGRVFGLRLDTDPLSSLDPALVGLRSQGGPGGFTGKTPGTTFTTEPALPGAPGSSAASQSYPGARARRDQAARREKDRSQGESRGVGRTMSTRTATI